MGMSESGEKFAATISVSCPELRYLGERKLGDERRGATAPGTTRGL